MIAKLPGEEGSQEFLLAIPFTPRNKQNLIGMMVARCDAEHLGELVYLQLPKQEEVIPGPLQVEALINQGSTNISKDLTLPTCGIESRTAAGAAQPGVDAARGSNLSVRRAHLHPGGPESAHAAAEKKSPWCRATL